MANSKELSDMDKPVNYTREAFLHPFNLAFLIAAFTSAFFLSGMDMLVNVVFTVTFAVELIYLGVVPRLPRFQKYINLTKFKERNSRFDERRIFGTLSESSQKKFLVLKHIAGMIRENFAKLPYPSQGMLDHINTRIESLLTSYMILLDGNERYEKYLSNSVEKKLKQEIESSKKDAENAESEKLRSVIIRRVQILQKRLEKYGLAREKYLISESQLKTIEDTIRYIYEKSMTLTNLEEIEHQMDSLLMDLDDTDLVFKEINHDLSVPNEIIDDLEGLERDAETADELLRRSKQKTHT